MISFLLRRLAQALGVMLVVGFVAFSLFRYVGDPVNNLLGQDATPVERARLRSDLGLDRPAAWQFARFVGRAVQGDFGFSLRQGRPVATLMAERLPATVELSLVAALLALGLGIPLGVRSAMHQGRPGVRWGLLLSLAGVSLPTFLVGIALIEVFAVRLHWLPSFGRGATVSLGPWTTGLLTADGWRHLVLPALTLAVYPLALIMRLVRADMLEVLRSEHLRFARARGLPEHVLHYRHALRNTLVPVIPVVGLQLGGLIAFSIITETVFAWPGMGNLFIQAVQFADVPVMAAYLCLIAAVFVSLNLVVDLLEWRLDPRLRRAKVSA